ncbi:MAG: S6e family ribosomal protein [Candidatus ainarchaeum sp.]|nr:S6e family ribosomal protein [Candidatus ainarchaeum sp.]MDD3975788.1 S6e family ribosomal protein [Candidatus ainarchaeum sp.]
MKLNISDPKTSKTYSVDADEKMELLLLGKKLKDEIELSFITPGLKAIITGGADKDGFPMHPSFDSELRKKMLLSGGVGFKPKRKGERRRKRVCGRIISKHIQLVNLKITSGDTKILDEKYIKPKEEKKE